MSILSLALYGSRARGDYLDSSDTDLFAVTDDEKYKMIINGETNIACYPVDLAVSRASSGDLFFMHIANEAVCLYDMQGHFDEIKRSFKYKPTYSEEIKNASELGYGLLANQDGVHDFSTYNKRIVWCIRTVLIARSAENRNPKFSAKDLSEMFGDSRIEDVIGIKDSNRFESSVYSIVVEMLVKFGGEISADMPNRYSELISYFESKGNPMGVRTARMFSHDMESDEYGWVK